MLPEFDVCYRAVPGRDARFDGWFFTAVRSTGVYCRPSCPATTPLARNVAFYPSAAAAQKAGFRACRRCRPDAAPGSPDWNARGDLVGRALRLIGDGVVDRAGVDGLAARLGYSARQVTRTLVAEVGAGPLALARAQRAQTARILLETTDLPATDVAFAAGFASVRQFNDTVRAVFATTPTGLRVRRSGPATGQLTLRLPYRPPMSFARTVRFLAARAVPGLEAVDDQEHGRECGREYGQEYSRVLDLPGGPGLVAVRDGDGFVSCRLRLTDLRDLTAAVCRVRRLLDLDADPVAIDAALPDRLVRRQPGIRSPGAVDGFELAVRAVVGQQVSVAGARTVLGRVVAAHGRPAFDGERWRLFPTAERLAAAQDLPLPARRAAAVRALAAAELTLDAGADRAATRAGLLAIPGIGRWTADYVLMRALGDPDVFLGTDLVVRRAAIPDPARYAPWRSYLTHHLWEAA